MLLSFAACSSGADSSASSPSGLPAQIARAAPAGSAVQTPCPQEQTGCSTPPPYGSPSPKPNSSRIYGTAGSDQQFRARVSSDANFAAAVASVDKKALGATDSTSENLATVLSAAHLSRPSQLNLDDVYTFNKTTNTLSVAARSSLKTSSAALEGQKLWSWPGSAAPPKRSYGGATTRSPVVDDQGSGEQASPDSYLNSVGWEYWIDSPAYSDTYIDGHAWVGAICTPDFVWFIPLGGCAVAHTGMFFNGRASSPFGDGNTQYFYGDNVGWTYAARQDDPSILNIGKGIYSMIVVDVMASTDDIYVEEDYDQWNLFS